MNNQVNNFTEGLMLWVAVAAMFLLGGCTFTEGWKLGGRVEHAQSGFGVSVDYQPKIEGFKK
jgi:hypothetical protein